MRVTRPGKISALRCPVEQQRPQRPARVLVLQRLGPRDIRNKSSRFTRSSFGSAKREVGRGSVRVRSYVVEQPVQEQVHLREERVHVERRPVDRPADIAVGTAEPFRERTIEVTATAEEPVVGKEARVKEEIVVSKDAEERTETVSDTVRRTEVEVDDDRAKAPATPPKP
jgi:uncharacterized protein (TIGR02271 family)